MKGSIVVFNKQNEMRVIEDIEETLLEDICRQKKQEHCLVQLADRKVDLGYISNAFFREGEIHTD
ncbi:hypothetical protein [Priestia endophytica]|uniref:hypothetical protein n=1 Tax=Priestia endophytica TaxID=135735 RepID=UPI000DCA84BE|nr:hypothetical protein [Priestia endophytica]RAS74037.1 hypothetical protein A4U60_22840 [Priestia endophytica]